MFRVILYGAIAFILFRIFRAIAGSVSRGSAQPPRRPASPPKQKQDFSNVQDAEFEDITPPKPPEGGTP